MLYIYVFQLWVFQKEFSCSFFINPLIFLWCFHFSSFFTCINRRCYLKSVIWYSFFTFKLLNGCIFIFSLQFSQLSMQHFIDQRPFFSFSQSHYFMRNFQVCYIFAWIYFSWFSCIHDHFCNQQEVLNYLSIHHI